jgi:hypothetical protein
MFDVGGQGRGRVTPELTPILVHKQKAVDSIEPFVDQ